jgi:arylsulfatase A-like enzyme
MADKPNIFVIFCDQLRRHALSCYGDPNIQTTHIDALAKHGVKFNAACSTYPICVPFRFSLMTGEYGHSHNVPGIGYRLDPARFRMLADPFNENGYHTAYFGKWHLADTGPSRSRPQVPPELQGRWQKWKGFEVRNSHFDTWYTEDDNPEPKKIEGYQTDGIFNLAMDHIRAGRPKDKPFFAICSIEPPHFPYEAPPELEAEWAQRDLKLPSTFMKIPDYPVHRGDGWDAPEQSQREIRLKNIKTYYAMVANLDENVGRLQQFLQSENLASNTIIVFMSDHGEMGGMHNINTAAKYFPFEESIGIPFIISDPTRPGSHGKSVDSPTCTEDFFPTFCGLADIDPGKELPGLDLSSVLGDTDTQVEREGVLLEFVHEHRTNAQYYGYTHRGIRTKTHKYVVRNGAPWLCFDLINDPLEDKNLLHHDHTNHKLFAELHLKLKQLLLETKDDYLLAPAWNCH